MDLASPLDVAGEETRQLFFLQNVQKWAVSLTRQLFFLQNVQKWAVSLPTEPNKQWSGFHSRETKYFICNVKWEGFLPSWVRSSFNAREAMNLIGGQKYVVVMTILSMSHKERCSHRIYGHFALTLNLYLFWNPKPSAISQTPFLVKKSPKLLCQILKKLLGL